MPRNVPGWAVVVVPLLLLADCGDGPGTEPAIDPTLTVSPGMQWAGGIVEASGEALADLENVVVLDDTLPVASERTGPMDVRVQLPNPSLSGTVAISVRDQSGSVVGSGEVEVVGSPRPVVQVLSSGCVPPCGYPRLESGQAPHRLSYHGVDAGSGRFLGQFLQDVAYVGMVVLEDEQPTVARLPGLEGDELQGYDNLPGLVGPGPATGGGRWVLDVSSAEAAGVPDVWSATPTVAPVGPLECLDSGITGGYSAVQLGSGSCFILEHAQRGETGGLLVDGTTPVPGYSSIPSDWTAGCARFEASEDGRWAALRKVMDWRAPDCSGDEGAPPAWPVLGDDGTVSFASSRYASWPTGVAFEPSGARVWTVGESDGWTLDSWNPATGVLESELAIDDVDACVDVLLDLVRPRVYVSCFRTSADGPADWPALFVYDREQEEIVAVLETLQGLSVISTWSPFELVLGGSSNRVHLVAVFDGTSAPADRGVLVASYDTF